MSFDPVTLRNGAIFYILLVASLCLRAFAQAWFARRRGDPTAAEAGRYTLNPVEHMDLLGTVVLPLICIFYLQPSATGVNFFLAWTKPVPINPSRMRNPERDYLLTQFSTTGMSALLALLGAVIGGLFYRVNPETVQIFGALLTVNATLIVLDCLPLPPLPGALLLKHYGLIKEETFWAIARWSGLAFIILINIPFIKGVLSLVIGITALPFFMVMQAVAL
ncbi:MAG: site-2 protease family protein [Opitutaceae bacterium]|nr:site-2 protease family protein [Opitutaceae bacterium]